MTLQRVSFPVRLQNEKLKVINHADLKVTEVLSEVAQGSGG